MEGAARVRVGFEEPFDGIGLRPAEPAEEEQAEGRVVGGQEFDRHGSSPVAIRSMRMRAGTCREKEKRTNLSSFDALRRMRPISALRR